MRSLGLILATVCCSAYASPSHYHRDFQRRNIVTSAADLQSSYDFIIVGGGTAGLTLASRLSEDSNHTVLVLEAGDTGDAVIEQIVTPGDTYYEGLTGSSFDWAFTTTAQPNAADRSLSWPRGKVLGGSSAINGLYAVRPSKLEYDTWSGMLEGADGADAWNWDTQFPAYKKSETFTSPSSALEQADTLEFSTNSHGTNGPLDVSWPSFQLPVVGNWSSTLAAAGIPTNSDPYGGSNTGAFIALSAINPSNSTRSYSRSAYIDPLPPRSNLQILPNATVTKINFSTTTDSSGNITATGVTYQTSSSGSAATINVNKEVILAGGAIGSPHVLMLSGVGPSDVLSAAGVNTVLSLPGVGQHMMDHIAAGISWTTTAETVAEMRDAGDTDASFLGYVNAAEAYVNLTTLFGSSQAQTYHQNVSSSIDTYANTLVPSSDDTVKAGYKAISSAISDTFMMSELGHVELLLSAQGQKGSTSQSIMIQCALQHPLSQGRLYITSSDAFTAPAIDPAYLSHPFDVTALREGLKLARTVGQTAPLSQYLTSETIPGSSVSTDAEWETWLASNFQTEYHPANTCAMLPKEKGGVVDPKLRVYGTANVRVADASVFPIQFAAHLQLGVYALAETAAEIVRAEYDGGVAPGESVSAGAGATATSTGAGSSGTGTHQADSNGAMSKAAAKSALAFAVGLGALSAVLAL